MSESWGESDGEPVLCAVANVTVLARETQSATAYVSERILLSMKRATKCRTHNAHAARLMNRMCKDRLASRKTDCMQSHDDSIRGI